MNSGGGGHARQKGREQEKPKVLREAGAVVTVFLDTVGGRRWIRVFVEAAVWRFDILFVSAADERKRSNDDEAPWTILRPLDNNNFAKASD